MYFVLNSASLSGVSTINLNFPTVGIARIKKKEMAKIKSKERGRRQAYKMIERQIKGKSPVID